MGQAESAAEHWPGRLTGSNRCYKTETYPQKSLLSGNIMTFARDPAHTRVCSGLNLMFKWESFEFSSHGHLANILGKVKVVFDRDNQER